MIMTFKIRGQKRTNFDGKLLVDKSDGETCLIKDIGGGYYNLYNTNPGRESEVRYKSQSHESIDGLINRNGWYLKNVEDDQGKK